MLIDELEAARDRIRESFHGIGQPIVRIPIEAITAYKDGDSIYATITYDDLIAVVEQAVK